MPLSRSGFLDKTLLSVANTAQHSLFSETYAVERGLLQGLDVRIKLITFLFIVVIISLVHRVESLWLLYGASLVLALFSRIPLGFFMKRVWLFVPLFSAAIVLPALLNIVTPGDPLWVLVKFDRTYRWGACSLPAEIAVTRQGLWGAVTFVSRVATSVSFAVLFTLTTRWSRVFSGLRSLFVPRIFVVTLSMTERYIVVFLRLIQDMYRARKSRTIRPFAPAIERDWTTSRIGVTFKKSIDMSEDIYKAMLSRGFQGEFQSLDRFHISPRDTAWTAAVLLVGGMLILIEKGFLLP
jgi:cobalt/nickel transport system permease protein